MMWITDQQVSELISMNDAIALMRHTFGDFGHGRGAVLPRSRALSASGSLSVMGAVLDGDGVMGAKVYATVKGQFNFVIVLFDNRDGSHLATVQGNTLTALRTPAVTRLAVDVLAPPEARSLAIFGSGVQARAHARALLADSALESVLVCAIEGADAFAAEIRQGFGVVVKVVGAEQAARDADVIVTATRASEPLFDSAWLRPDACVAAIGSSKPTAREVDTALVSRAAVIGVEWREQTLREAGDLVLAGDRLDPTRVRELGELVADGFNAASGQGLRLFKSVGIGLEDVALAHLAYRKARLVEA